MNKNKIEIVKGLVRFQGKFLILKQDDYDLPGGNKLITDEPDDVALRRVIKDLIGMDIEIAKLLNEWKQDKIFGKTYLCHTDIDIVTTYNISLDFFWGSKEEIEQLPLPSWLKNAFTKL